MDTLIDELEPVNIHSDPLEKRLKRLRREIAARDYEGVTTVLTSDLVEVLAQFPKCPVCKGLHMIFNKDTDTFSVCPSCSTKIKKE